MKVIFVRHAETEWNSRGIIQGHSDSALTHRGVRETSALLAALAASDYQIECIYASPLGRAWQMGQRLAECFHCSLLAEAALKEQAFGQFEGMSANHLLQNHPDDVEALFRFDAAYCPPGGESLAHASQRVLSFLHSLEATSHHQTICIVSHGHVSQGVLATFKEGTVDNFSWYAQPNASYSVFELINGRCMAVRWGIATHLLHLER
ncbi:histidine phosphatase family protein [Leclercia pneumoniae]|uniref:histidine phosphatase family protein n=1 Tax=Leclercia pneumoniae TaxID=2815358 RepID=UPI0021E5C195|nr:histidine phosphatase family protein [Leclercia pneumoniae]MCV2513105.1 histidine phosphatase family protein [Leclercia pneumoniae]WNN79306.1 histidine phosphatase family protein [Leclercia pneumoniae]